MIATNEDYWHIIREVMADFPETMESTSYGTPAYKVNKKLLLRIKEDGKTLVLHSDDRDIFLAKELRGLFCHRTLYQLSLCSCKIGQNQER